MNPVEESLKIPQLPLARSIAHGLGSAFSRTGAGSGRFAVYLACATAAVVANGLLGKDMMWDTRSYHLYAGFSALHDRFGMDYFPAGPQSYFNPYVYVPFYLLAMSRLPAIWAASILAVAQSAILWLTYELALQVAPADHPRGRIAAGACAVTLAFANPILIGQLGSSYADITTAELVLAGWLLLLHALRSPGWIRVLGAGLILGAVSALKLTNVAHALAASMLVLFIPGGARAKVRSLAGFWTAVSIGFLAVATPWALRLQHQFGNPFFPLLNAVFRSPQYSTAAMLDYRFIPDSLADALWRPFEIMSAAPMVDNEVASPDLRYALLAILGAVALIGLLWRRRRESAAAAMPKAQSPAWRGLAALGCAFVVDWVLWLRASGNGRYFLAMACVAGILVAALAVGLLAQRPKLRNYLLLLILLAQGTQLALGAEFRYSAWWNGGPWFQVAMSREPSTASLYFTYGDPPNSFLAPFLPHGSGLINIGGDHALVPGGANGERVQLLIRKYAPHLRLIMMGRLGRTGTPANATLFAEANDALAPFGLRAEPGNCASVDVPDVNGTSVVPAVKLRRSPHYKEYSTLHLLTCPVVSTPVERDPQLAARRAAANVVFNRVEDACPELFQPARPTTRNYSTRRDQIWARRYEETSVTTLVGPEYVVLTFDDRPGAPAFLGRESDWERAPLRLACGRRNERYFARLLPQSP